MSVFLTSFKLAIFMLICLTSEIRSVPFDSSATTGHFSENSSALPVCSQACVAREEIRNATLDNIKQQILMKLGMTAPPQISAEKILSLPPIEQLLGPHSSPVRTTSEIQSDQPVVRDFGHPRTKPTTPEDVNIEDYYARTNKIISFATKNTKMTGILTHLPVQFFNFSDAANDSKVRKANLWVYVTGTRQRNNISSSDNSDIPIIDIRVFKAISTTPYLEPTGEITAIKLPEAPGMWVNLDVTHIVSEWFSTPESNLGIDIVARDATGRNLIKTSPSQMTPFIEVHTTQGKQRRNRRSVGLDCTATSEERRCCRYPLVVDFEEFGWDWVIAPKKYDAYYCAGECPFVFLQRYPHTHVVTQVVNRPSNAGPCCGARKLGNISMLYFNTDATIMLSTLPNMVVETCGCF